MISNEKIPGGTSLVKLLSETAPRFFMLKNITFFIIDSLINKLCSYYEHYEVVIILTIYKTYKKNFEIRKLLENCSAPKLQTF